MAWECGATPPGAVRVRPALLRQGWRDSSGLGMPQRLGDEVRGGASQKQYTHPPELRGDRTLGPSD